LKLVTLSDTLNRIARKVRRKENVDTYVLMMYLYWEGEYGGFELGKAIPLKVMKSYEVVGLDILNGHDKLLEKYKHLITGDCYCDIGFSLEKIQEQ